MREYRFVGRKHQAEDGHFLKFGEIVKLSDSAAEAFRDRFRLASEPVVEAVGQIADNARVAAAAVLADAKAEAAAIVEAARKQADALVTKPEAAKPEAAKK